MNELDLLYSQLMKKLVDLSSPVKISENAASDNMSQIGSENISEPLIKASSSLSNQIVSLHSFKLIESSDKTETSPLTDTHQYLSKEFIIKHTNSSNVITEATNHSTVTEDCVIASKQKNTPTQIHTKCISASLLHNNLEHEDEQCHYSNEFWYAKKIINEKDTDEPVDVTFMVKSKEATDNSGNEHKLIVTEINKDESFLFDASPIIQTDPNLHKNNNNS
uniref:Uncharacterized protein n=1 Tax=Hottentotta judaicus TaxID=6863 RepID=F1CJ28_HOTJU|nr:hypothetical protein [Hottentotta judaicus]